MKPVEKLQSGETYADLAGALSTGLCTGTLVSMITSMSDSRLSLMMWVQSVTTAVACYTVCNILLHKWWTGHLRRMIPTWLLTAALGTFLFICITVVPDAIAAWGSPQRVEATLSEFILVRLEDARSVLMAFGFIALLIMATFHYGSTLAMAIRKWHYGGDELSAFLGRCRLFRRFTLQSL